MLKISHIQAYSDNYIWLIQTNEGNTLVDPGDAGPVLDFIQKEEIEIDDILITHHHFDHVGGLYLKVGREKARLAEHEPNHNQWDWQEFAYEEVIPSGVTSLRAGFVHQSGGALWAKNPSLVIVDCPG